MPAALVRGGRSVAVAVAVPKAFEALSFGEGVPYALNLTIAQVIARPEVIAHPQVISHSKVIADAKILPSTKANPGPET